MKLFSLTITALAYLCTLSQGVADLQWAGGNAVLAPIQDPDTGTSLANGSLVQLIRDSGLDGPGAALENGDAEGDELVAFTAIDSPIPGLSGTFTSVTPSGSFVPAGLYYVRVWNTPSPTAGAWVGNSMAMHPGIVSSLATPMDPAGAYLWASDEQLQTFNTGSTAGQVIILNQTVSPEPTVAVLLGLSSLGIMVGRKLRRRSLAAQALRG